MSAWDLLWICGTIVLCAGSIIGVIKDIGYKILAELRAIQGIGPR